MIDPCFSNFCLTWSFALSIVRGTKLGVPYRTILFHMLDVTTLGNQKFNFSIWFLSLVYKIQLPQVYIYTQLKIVSTSIPNLYPIGQQTQKLFYSLRTQSSNQRLLYVHEQVWKSGLSEDKRTELTINPLIRNQSINLKKKSLQHYIEYNNLIIRYLSDKMLTCLCNNHFKVIL